MKVKSKHGVSLASLITKALEKFDKKRGASTKEIKHSLRNDGHKYKSKSIKICLYKLEDKKVLYLYLGRWILTGKKIKAMRRSEKQEDSSDKVQDVYFKYD